MTRIQIVPGLAMPFYPMRPRRGKSLKVAADVREILEAIERGDTVQPKLNGDRACLAIHEGKTYFQNRHGNWMSGTCLNKDTFIERLEGTYVLDGELWQKNFYPFEAIVAANESFIDKGPEERRLAARIVCAAVGLEWLYETPIEAWLAEWTAKQSTSYDSNPKIEGVVIKKKDSPYRVLPTESGESLAWSKRKWVL